MTPLPLPPPAVCSAPPPLCRVFNERGLFKYRAWQGASFLTLHCFCYYTLGTVPSCQGTDSHISAQFTSLRKLEEMFICVNWNCQITASYEELYMRVQERIMITALTLTVMH